MDLNKTFDIEVFFQTVKSGSVDELKKIVKDCGPEERSRMANSFNIEGETPLMVAIKEDQKPMIRYLVDQLKANFWQLGRFIWNGLDYPQVPPLFAAVFCITDTATYPHPRSFIHSLIDQDIDNNGTPNSYIDDILSSHLSPAMKMHVLKLLGAVYLFERCNRTGNERLEFGIRFWSAAISICQDGDSTSTAIPFTTEWWIRSSSQDTDWSRKLFQNVSECKTLGELEEIRRFYYDFFYVVIRALFVIQHVMSEIYPHPRPYLSFALLRFSHFLKENGCYARELDVFMFCVEPLRVGEWKDAINLEWPFEVVYHCLCLLSYSLFKQKRDNGGGIVPPPDNPQRLHFPVFFEALRCFSSFHSKMLVHRGAVPRDFSRLVFKMVKCLKELPSLNPDESKVLKLWLSSYISDIESHPRVFTLLHSVCRDYPQDIETIQLLLNAGASPFSTDEQRNSPLCYLTLAFIKTVYFNGTAVQSLLNAGAHLDQANAQGITPLMKLKELKLILAQRNIPPDLYLNSLCNTFIPLTCLSAQVVSKNEMSCDDLPNELKCLVKKH